MSNSVIGALRVNLGLDSAQFQTGLKNSKSSLDRFGAAAVKAFAAVSAAGVAMAGALAVGIKRTIDEADNLSKSAQKFGVATEELGRLKHAADLSGVSMEGLGTGLRVLSRNLQEFANGAKNSAAQAFRALGIEARNADGSLKSSSQVMTEVAAKFATMQDGAQKTALAMAIFGRSGADLIPMLNAGADGLQAMKDEADALGIVIDGNTARAAENFNDNLTRLGRVKDGLIMKITAQLLPALENLSEWMINFARDGDAVQSVATGIGEVFQWVAKQAATLVGGIRGIRAEINSLAEVGSKLSEFDFGGARDAWNRGQQEAERIRNETVAAVEKITSGMATSQAGIQRVFDTRFSEAGQSAGEAFVANFEKATSGGSGRAKAALDPMVREGERIFEQTRTAAERYHIQIMRLRELLAAGAINQDEFNCAVLQAQDAFEQAEKAGKKTENVFQQIGQTIGNAFSTAFSSIIDGSKKVGEVVSDVMRQLGQMLLSRAFQSLVGFLFPGGAPILNSGGGFAGMIGYRANGGPVSAGRPYIVGERGPELMVPSSSGSVISNRELMNGRGGSGAMQINVNVTGARGNAEIMEMVTAGVRQGITAYDRDVAPSTVHRVVNNPRARG